MTAPSEDTPRPLLRVVRGEPSPEQLAALVAVLSTRGGAEEPEPAVRSAWGNRPRAALPLPGPGAWRTSGLPV